MSYPVISADARVQAHYEHCRDLGTSHLLAEMFALAIPPQSNTDVEFMAGRHETLVHGNPVIDTAYRRRAEAAGVHTRGKVYLGQLANEPGDPKAWVSSRGDVERVCQERGYGCSGLVTVGKDGRKDEAPAASPGLADSIVNEEADIICAREPEKKRKRQQVKDEIRLKRTPHWNKGK